eukprot:363121-Chlamydomonas_euryale.AAC.6
MRCGCVPWLLWKRFLVWPSVSTACGKWERWSVDVLLVWLLWKGCSSADRPALQQQRRHAAEPGHPADIVPQGVCIVHCMDTLGAQCTSMRLVNAARHLC